MGRVVGVRGCGLKRKRERKNEVRVSFTAPFPLLSSPALPPSFKELLRCDLAHRTLKYVGRNTTIIKGIG